MKNILLITNIYPNNDPEYLGTKVCHAFTREWSKMGYNVRVIHFDSLFPRPFYWVAKLFKSMIQAKTGSVAYTKTPRTPKQYYVDEIPVLFIPLKKLFPHKAPSKNQTERAFSLIVEILKKNGFEPEIITAHFVLPQLQFLPLFKGQYPNAKTCMVMHGGSNELPFFYPKTYKVLMRSVDIWGVRSKAFQLDFIKSFNDENPPFICYSGIPSKYLENITKEFPRGVRRFAFIGSLFKLKNVDITLRALSEVMENKDYHFDIVGGGAEKNNLENLVAELGIQDNVTFHGKMNRDDAQEIVRKADCFVMVSTREAFGLVYLEAMAKGCIVIGTKGQGIDGVIMDNVNGFLCGAEDVNELVSVIKKIKLLPSEELQRISINAIKTARNLTDESAAKKYVDNIIERM